MERQHTNTRITISATDLHNALMEALLHGSASDPPDIYVECEVKDVEDDHENS